MKQPKGYKSDATIAFTRISVSLPDSLFKNIRSRAETENRSFSNVVDELCRVGILDLDESDALEP